MNIQDTIEHALASAGLNTQSGPLRGVTETIRKALTTAGLGRMQRATTPIPKAQRPPTGVQARATTEASKSAATLADGSEAVPGQFLLRSHSASAGTRSYRLYVPARPAGQSAGRADKPMPLVLMLHGCTQSAEDFAAGTQMNRLADEQGFLVAYPEQDTDANPSRCWNWFRSDDQQRGSGEPSLLAGIVMAVSQECAVDTRRVYVAGLSAGAAMAVVLGETYPDVFAAVGAHSGLPYAAAHDIPSAMAAMKGRSFMMGMPHFPGTADDPRRPSTHAVPVIVFHGDRDHTVQHSNGETIVQRACEAYAHLPKAAHLVSSHEEGEQSGRRYTRNVHSDAHGTPRVEQWTLHGAGHTWSGGNPKGSYTDSGGPDASAEMLRFFLAQA